MRTWVGMAAALALVGTVMAVETRPDGRKLVWSDEFEGDALDLTKWRFRRTMNSTDCTYTNDSRTARVENGCLRLRVVPSGDPALTRRLKAAAPEYWAVHRRFGRREGHVGLCVPKTLRAGIQAQLAEERERPEYQRKLAAGRRRRDREQHEYQQDFKAAVVAFLDFDGRWKELARRLAHVITLFTTPVGSGTVARTERIPIEERARAAVIAWMRHNTTDYDERCCGMREGARKEVRRQLAQESVMLLNGYRRGHDAAPGCPLQAGLEEAEKRNAVKAAEEAAKKTMRQSVVSAGDFWL